ncbi:DUF6884 domain-containing protein [Mesorhizobium sp. LSJC265A00]|uniref:DUF6884 domain-containing protein n=1 Tax=Mesorhizobium sp. LSJC265A00 TaxID=1287322 RepID=UPI0012EC2FAB|nr:DUF6884 domain-containing protein [Mesorhizobium sp. LSJC265A00]
MNQADRIRDFVLSAYVAPARSRRFSEVEVRAGDVHREMSLTNAMPAVCSALGSNKFEEFAGVRTIERTGPSNGSNARFQFQILDQPALMEPPPLPPAQLAKEASNTSVPQPLVEPDTIVLVSCVKSKLPNKAKAQDLYISAQFRGARRFAEAAGRSWYVLSALYGLVDPDAVIAPYDYTLNSLGVAERRAWATKTLDQLIEAEPNLKRVTILAGRRYREFLEPALLRRGVAVNVPMANLRQGEQLAWLARDQNAAG